MESDSPVSIAPPSVKYDVDLFWEAQEDPTMDTMSPSITICAANSNKARNLHGWADCVDVFIQVVKQTNKMQIVPNGTIVGLAHLVQENAASDWIDSIWLVNNRVDFNTYRTLYQFKYMNQSVQV